MSTEKETIWSFDLGKGSIGEAVRLGMKFLHVASLIIPAEFAETQTAAKRRRFFRTRQAHRARESWLREVFTECGLEVLSGRSTTHPPGQQKIWVKQVADPRFEKEFPAPDEGDLCYTSCLLRIKLLRGEKLEPWQLYKAFHSAIQRRGYDPDIPWKTKERTRSTDKPEAKANDEEGATLARMTAYEDELKAMAPDQPQYQWPCYFDAWKMGLWSPKDPEKLSLRINQSAGSTRNQIVPRKRIEAEIRAMVKAAAVQYPALNGKEDYLLYGPPGKAYASYDLALRKEFKLHEGSAGDWQGVLGQKIPRFDNRIIAKCALIPRLNVCKIRTHEIEVDGKTKSVLHPSSQIVAEVTFLMKLKNIRFWRGGVLAQLTAPELKAVFEYPEFKSLKITATQWRKYCNKTLGGYPNSGSEEVEAPRTSGRSSYCRPALEIAKRLLLSGLTPSQSHANELTLLNGNENPQKGLIPKDLTFLTRMGDSWEKLYLPNQKLDALVNLSTDSAVAIRSLIGMQNDPIVRHRLNLFYGRICDLGKKFGTPSHVVIEFIREDFMGDKAKFELRKFQRERTKERAAARLQAKELGQEGRAAGLKLELFKAQGGCCVYTGELLAQTKLDEYEIEHIVPREMGGPDAVMNYVLTTHKTNAEKGKRTPHQWLSGSIGWDAYKERVDQCKTVFRNKKVQLLTSPDAETLVQKYTALAETAWITKLAQTILSIHFGWQNGFVKGERKVTVVNGSLTARIRRVYKLNSILHPDTTDEEEAEKKNRDDDRHHALDAMCINFTPDWSKNPSLTGHSFFKFPDGIDRNYFDKYIQGVTPEKVCVEKPSLGESIYGVRGSDGAATMVKRYPVSSLAYKSVGPNKVVYDVPTARKKIQSIRDEAIKNHLQGFLETTPDEADWNNFCKKLSLSKSGEAPHRVHRVFLDVGTSDEFKDLSKDGTGAYRKGAKGHKGQILYRDAQGKARVRPVYVFESTEKVTKELKASSSAVQIIGVFRSGDRVQLTQDVQHPKTPLSKGTYILSSMRADGYTALKNPAIISLPISVSKLLDAGFAPYQGADD